MNIEESTKKVKEALANINNLELKQIDVLNHNIDHILHTVEDNIDLINAFLKPHNLQFIYSPNATFNEDWSHLMDLAGEYVDTDSEDNVHSLIESFFDKMNGTDTSCNRFRAILVGLMHVADSAHLNPRNFNVNYDS